MITKITPHIFKIVMFKRLLVAVMLLVVSNAFTQTITDVFPTRVTTGSVVTIIGTGFTTTTRNNIGISGISTTNKILVSSTEMRFEILFGGSGDILNRVLNIGGGINASQRISYIAPEPKTLTNSASFFIKEIYTNWNYNNNGFWRSNNWASSGTKSGKDCLSCPNDYHELIGYKMSDNKIYSTGVDNGLLEAKLKAAGDLTQDDIDAASGTSAGLKYYRKVFKAYSTNGVKGFTNSANYIVTGDLIDEVTSPNESATNNDLTGLININNLTIFDVIIDGKNGLELGTGITNFNNDTDVQFFSGNGKPGAVNDAGTPDLLITQIAQAGGTDVYYYVDDLGNVVGRPLKLFIPNDNDTTLANWRLDLFSFPNNQSFTTVTPNKRGFTSNQDEYRPIRMAGLRLEDFEITTAAAVESIENINMTAGGTADIAFMAYNQESFDIKGPLVRNALSRFVCVPDGSPAASATFQLTESGLKINVGIDDDAGGIREPLDASEDLRYQLLRFNLSVTGEPDSTPSLTVPNVDPSKLGVYKIKIENNQGTTFALVNLSQGGTPYTWDGTLWGSPYGVVDSKERSLIFASSYNKVGDLEGCDCFVAAGVDVVIPDNNTMKLYGAIKVAPEVPFVSGVTSYLPAGKFTLEDNASLIQTKPLPLVGGVNANENSGQIIVNRIAKELKKFDYVYWSSPLANFNIGGLYSSRTYEWDVEKNNGNGSVGNWIAPTGGGIMTPGKGFIVRVPTPVPPAPPLVPGEKFTLLNSFTGIPNNGEYTIPVLLSPGKPIADADSGWNLIGNPYPSPINGDSFLSTNAAIDGGVYIWTHGTEVTPGGSNPFYQDFGYNYNSDDYLVYNGTASTDPDFSGNIASGQGFFVKAKTAGNVRFTNAMRFEAGGDNYDNSQFFRSSGESKGSTGYDSEKQLLWLALTNEAKTATVAVVGYVQGATYEKDNLYDASHMGANDFSLYTQVAEDRLVIQGRPLPFDSSDEVTLGVAVPKNGIYSIAIDHLKGSIMLNTEQGIYLEDTYQNVIHDLRNAPYSFTATAGDKKDRFVLRYTDRQLSVDEQQLSDTFVYVKNDQLHVKASKNIDAIVVYDLTGKKLTAYNISGNSERFSMPFQFPKGVYLTVVTLENSATVTKKVMN